MIYTALIIGVLHTSLPSCVVLWNFQELPSGVIRWHISKKEALNLDVSWEINAEKAQSAMQIGPEDIFQNVTILN